MAFSPSPGPMSGPAPAMAPQMAAPPPLPPQALQQPPAQPPAMGRPPRFLSLSTLRAHLHDYDTAKRNERDEAEQARRYYHGDQWTEHEVQVLRERGQPVVTFNRSKRKIDGIIGLVERLRQDPKGYPRTPQHQAGADVATAVLNEVLDANQWRSLSPMVAKDGAIEPLAGIELSLEPGDQGDPDITLSYLEPDTIFYDPRSSREDFRDARFIGVAKWVAIDVAQDMFPDHADALKEAATSGGAFDALMDTDRQRQMTWSNSTAKQVRLVEHWYKQGNDWLWQFYCGDIDLDRGVSPFVDEKGRGICRFIIFSASVDHDNDRYAFMRDLKSPQDEVNHRRSKALHSLNSTRVYIDDMGLDDEAIEAIRREIVRPDGVVKKPPGVNIEEKSNTEQVSGNFQMLSDARQEIDGFGPNNAAMGDAASASSGRALQLLQQAGIAELGPYILGYRDWKIRVYRAVWNAVQQHWTAQRWIRVTGDNGLAQFLAVNQLGFDPQTGRPIIENALGSLDVDIILDEGPDHHTFMEDALQALMQLAPGMAQAGKPLPPDIIIELMDLPQELKNKLLGYLQQSNQQDPQAQQLQQTVQQIQLQGAAAKVGETQARTEKLHAEALAAGARANSASILDQQHAVNTAATIADIAHKTARTNKVSTETARDHMNALAMPAIAPGLGHLMPQPPAPAGPPPGFGL